MREFVYQGQPTRVVFGVRQEGRHLLPGRLVQEVHERPARLPRRLLDTVGGVVGSQQPHPQPALGGRQGEKDLGVTPGVQAEEEVLGLHARQPLELPDPLGGREDRPHVFQVGDGPSLPDLPLHRVLPLVGE